MNYRRVSGVFRRTACLQRTGRLLAAVESSNLPLDRERETMIFRPTLTTLALAVAALSCSVGAAQAAEYQYHHRVKGLVVTPSSVEPACDDPFQAAIGERSTNFCGHEGFDVFVAGAAGGHGVLFSTADDSNAIYWSKSYTNNSGIPDCVQGSRIGGGACTTFTEGASYTAAMMAVEVDAQGAALVCTSKGAGWYLPAIAELDLLWKNRSQINYASVGFTASSGVWYWSSTENGSHGAWMQRLSDGYQYNNLQYKTALHHVRCARSF